MSGLYATATRLSTRSTQTSQVFMAHRQAVRHRLPFGASLPCSGLDGGASSLPLSRGDPTENALDRPETREPGLSRTDAEHASGTYGDPGVRRIARPSHRRLREISRVNLHAVHLVVHLESGRRVRLPRSRKDCLIARMRVGLPACPGGRGLRTPRFASAGSPSSRFPPRRISREAPVTACNSTKHEAIMRGRLRAAPAKGEIG